jgi:GWxTD domain-containing protein
MPSILRRRVGALGAPALLLALVAGCTSWQRVGSSKGSSPDQQLLQLFDPMAMYTRLGRIVSADQIPFIGTVALIPGHGDSTQAIVGLSLGNRAFAFERSGAAWLARYRVEYTFERPGAAPVTVGRDENLRVDTFQETGRIDESVLLQQVIQLAPGDYTVTVRVRDRGSDRVGTGKQQMNVPAFSPGTVSAPVLAYEVAGRGKRTDSLRVVLNPRGTIAFGEDTLLVYFEGTGFTRPTDVPIEIRDERDSVVFRSTARFTGTREVESQFVRIAPDSAPLGQLTVVVGAPPAARLIHGIVSFSSNWVVTNFDDLLDLLRYFGNDAKIATMRKASREDRGQLWRDFVRETDPNSGTPENELLANYFARLAYANTRFRDEGIAGWRTDRGEVFIGLGEPDEIYDQSLQTGPVRYMRWIYNEARVTLYFEDISGFGRFRLVPTSRGDFESAKARMKRR